MSHCNKKLLDNIKARYSFIAAQLLLGGISGSGVSEGRSSIAGAVGPSAFTTRDHCVNGGALLTPVRRSTFDPPPRDPVTLRRQ